MWYAELAVSLPWRWLRVALLWPWLLWRMTLRPNLLRLWRWCARPVFLGGIALGMGYTAVLAWLWHKEPGDWSLALPATLLCVVTGVLLALARAVLLWGLRRYVRASRARRARGEEVRIAQE